MVCGQVYAQSLQTSMVIMAVLYTASSLFFVMTWRRLDKDWWIETEVRGYHRSAPGLSFSHSTLRVPPILTSVFATQPQAGLLFFITASLFIRRQPKNSGELIVSFSDTSLVHGLNFRRDFIQILNRFWTAAFSFFRSSCAFCFNASACFPESPLWDFQNWPVSVPTTYSRILPSPSKTSTLETTFSKNALSWLTSSTVPL